MNMFPRTEVEGISLPRMLMGTNWLLGFSHRSPSADDMIVNRHSDPLQVAAVAEAYMQYGIDATMAPHFDPNSAFRKGLDMVEEKYGKEITKIVTPGINVDDNATAREEAAAVIKQCAKDGAKICLIHHGSAEQLVNKNKQTIERLPDYLYMIRENGMVPGLSAHMPELVLYSDANEYDVQTYIQIYNCLGFLMQFEVEGVNRIIWESKKPVMTIKSMAAGRCTPFVGLSFSFNTIRPCDMVTLGAFNPNEVHEDVEIAMAAIEHRQAFLGRRASPVKQSLFGDTNK